jgi:hypothetical protein
MFSVTINNLRETYNRDQTFRNVGRSFLFSGATALILNAGNTAAALISGGIFGVLTFNTCILSPIIAGLFGKDVGEPLNSFQCFMINSLVIVTAVVIANLVLQIFIDPYILGLSLVIPLIMRWNDYSPVGIPIPIMSLYGSLAALVWEFGQNKL